MRLRRMFSAPVFLGALTCGGFALGQAIQSQRGEQSRPADTTNPKPDPAERFALLVEGVLRGKEAVEMEFADLPQHPDLRQFLTAPPNGRYLVKQLTFSKGAEIRALSVALHSPHDTFFIRGKEAGDSFDGMYYIVDRSGFLQGAVAREGKTVAEVSRGDAWQAYEQEKAFWMWQAEQTTNSAEPAR
jgi:hypothetical protein